MEIFRLFGSIFINDDDASNRIDRVDNKGKGLAGTFGTIGVAVGAAALAVGAMAATAVVALGVKSVGAADELQKALNKLQQQTGSTDDEIKGMRDSLLSIYEKGYGESFNDIAMAMSEVAKTTGLAGKELEETTQNALMLADSFDMDINETARTANSLMKNFGITSKQAYTLMAQGAQNGANKNGDLLDTLNEYSPQFKALGFSAEQFTDTLIQGAKNGSFSIDKVGDAIKEFTIRSKDMSKSSLDAFSALSMNGEQMSAQFAKGGESAQAAFQQVTTALASVKDPLQQNAIGVALFGTQFEDLEAGAITALANINSATDMSANTLDKINQLQFNTFGEAMTGIKRQFETSILIPIGEKVLPILNQFANWLQGKMPEIKAWIADAMGNSGKVLEGFGKVWTWLKDTIIKPIMDWLVPFIQKTLAAIKKYWDENGAGIKQTLGTLLNWIKVIFQTVFPIIQGIVETAFNVIGAVISAVVDVISGVIKVIDGIFRGDWKKMWEGAVQIFEGIFGGIENIVKGVVNGVIRAVNGMIKGLNRVKVDVPDWVKELTGVGGSFGFNIPTIPMLAKGGNILDNGSVIVGEKGPELLSGIKGAKVTPLDKVSNHGETVVHTHIHLDGKEIATSVSRHQANSATSRSRAYGGLLT
ncbi:phage tail tape measure protein [Paenibacillus sp. sgz302251]|uniref:phage tail tape measure protein n=1 Tax=Paenibacillus sp. sgz302251 TaxID=3414493 RepID=UPI003C7C8FFE